jgi:hypothetical protein
MTLAYAVQMTLEAEDGSPASVRSIADQVGWWARVPDPLVEGTQPGRNDALVTTEILGDPQEMPWAWRLSFSHRDSVDTHVQWGVRVTAIAAETTVLSVRLDRTRIDGVVARDRTDPAPPGCIGAVMGCTELFALDGGRRFGPDVWVVAPEEAEDLADLVVAEDRRLPIFAFTPRDEEVIDGSEILRLAAGLAHVVFIRSETSWRLDELLPRGLNVYGGAARIWWPEVTEDSSRFDHPLWTGDSLARDVIHEVKTAIVEAGLAAAMIDRRVIELEQRRRTLESRAQNEELQGLIDGDAEVVSRLQAILGDDEEVESGSEKSGLGQLIGRALQRKDDEIDQALELAVRAEEEAGDERERIGGLSRKISFLEGELTRLLLSAGSSDGQGVAAINEEQFLIEEIDREAASRQNVRGFNPRRFQLGSSFLHTVEQHGERYRQKIVKTCGDIASGAPALITRRNDHQLRMKDDVTAPTKTRERDGAEARRCYVEERTHAARRLHYWLLPDHSVEFASVNVHDDMSIPG